LSANLHLQKKLQHIYSIKGHYRYRETLYHITVLQTRNVSGETSVTVDGIEQPDNAIPLVDDRQEHSAEVRIAVR
jgi:hypothetical protein